MRKKLKKRCAHDKHDFVSTRIPNYSESGVHEEQCRICGYKIWFDTSD